MPENRKRITYVIGENFVDRSSPIEPYAPWLFILAAVVAVSTIFYQILLKVSNG